MLKHSEAWRWDARYFSYSRLAPSPYAGTGSNHNRDKTQPCGVVQNWEVLQEKEEEEEERMYINYLLIYSPVVVAHRENGLRINECDIT